MLAAERAIRLIYRGNVDGAVAHLKATAPSISDDPRFPETFALTLNQIMHIDDFFDIPSLAIINKLFARGVTINFRQFLNRLSGFIDSLDGKGQYPVLNANKPMFEKRVINGIGVLLLLQVHPNRESIKRGPDALYVPKADNIVAYLKKHKPELEAKLVELNKVNSIFGKDEGGKTVRKLLELVYGPGHDLFQLLEKVSLRPFPARPERLSVANWRARANKKAAKEAEQNAEAMRGTTQMSMANFLGTPASEGGAPGAGSEEGNLPGMHGQSSESKPKVEEVD